VNFVWRPVRAATYNYIKEEGDMRNRISVLVCISCAVITGLLLIENSFAQDFSADVVSKSKEGTHKGRMFISGAKTRMEMADSVMISRPDKSLVWMLMPQQKMYMESPLTPQNIIMTEEKAPGEISRKFIATETIDGKPADKYEVVYASGNRNEAVFVWLLKDIKFPVKTTAKDGSWSIEYKNINTAKQGSDLFEIPSGYKKFSYQMPFMNK
jgi:hypothetical protein